VPAGPPTDVSAVAAGMTPQAATGLALAAVPTAVRCSRMFVSSCLRQWGLLSLADDSELVVSELVTNAVAATGVTEAEPRWSQLAGLATIHVRVMLFEASIVIAVWDKNPASPVLRQSAPDCENGRGLSIVAALCKRRDYFLLDSGGKCVWAELAYSRTPYRPPSCHSASPHHLACAWLSPGPIPTCFAGCMKG
jgi:anti-sigma regulatory factor (Ser/Thr protein kinase)